MYTYTMMRRTQVYLSDDESRVLDQEAAATGRTRSDLIRDAIDQCYLRGRAQSEKLSLLMEAFGSWASRDESSEDMEDQLRSGSRIREILA